MKEAVVALKERKTRNRSLEVMLQDIDRLEDEQLR